MVIAKTGLGSSAALVTALTASMLVASGLIQGVCSMRLRPNPVLFTERNQASLETIHNLAQLSHCVAQGKIGSGYVLNPNPNPNPKIGSGYVLSIPSAC